MVTNPSNKDGICKVIKEMKTNKDYELNALLSKGNDGEIIKFGIVEIIK